MANDQVVLKINKKNMPIEEPKQLVYRQDERGKVLDISVFLNDDDPFDLSDYKITFIENKDNGKLIVDAGDAIKSGKFTRTSDGDKVGQFSYQIPEFVYSSPGTCYFQFTKDEKHIDSTNTFTIDIATVDDALIEDVSFVSDIGSALQYSKSIGSDLQDKAKQILDQFSDDSKKALEDGKTSLDSAIGDTKKNVQDLVDSVNEQQERINKINDDWLSSKASIKQDATNQLEEIKKDFSDWQKQEVAELTDKLNKLTSSIEQSSEQFENMQSKIDSLQKALKTIDGLDFSQYALKTDVYSKEEVDQKLANAGKVQTVNGTKPDAGGNISLEIPKQPDLSDYEKTEDVDTKLATKANTSDVYTKTEVDQKIEDSNKLKTIDGLQPDDKGNIDIPSPDLSPYAKSKDVDAELATKANSADVYDKKSVDQSLALKADKTDTYNKSEIDDKITAISKASDGKISSTEVMAALSTKANSADVYTKKDVDSKLDTKAEKVDVESELATKADSSSIYTKDDLDSKFASLDDVKQVNGIKPDKDGNITLSIPEAPDLAPYDKIEDVDKKLAVKANTADLYSKEEIDTAIKNADGKVKSVNSVKPDEDGNISISIPEQQDLTPYAKTSDVDTELATKANASDVYTKAEVDTAINIGKVKTVNGNKPDTNGNVSIEIPQAPDLSDYVKSETLKADLDTKLDKTDAISQENVDASVKSAADKLTTEINAKANSTDVESNTKQISSLATQLAAAPSKDDLQKVLDDLNKLRTQEVPSVNAPNIDDKFDLNNPFAGWRRFWGAKPQNAPDYADVWGYVYEFKMSEANSCLQVMLSLGGSTTLSLRFKFGGAWTAWVQLAYQGDVNSQISQLNASLTNLINSKASSADVYSKAQIDAKLDTINKAADGSVTSAELATKLDTKANSADVYTKKDVDSKLADKADKSSTELEIAGKANLTDVYDKSTIDDKLKPLGKVKTVNGTKPDDDGNVNIAIPAQPDLTPYDKTADVDSKLATKANAADVYTKAQVDSAVQNAPGKVKTVNGATPDDKGNITLSIPKSPDLTQYDTTADVNTKLSAKANSADVYSKKDVDSKLSAKADQASVNTQMASTVKTVNGNKPDTKGNVSINIPAQPDLSPYAKTSDVNLSLNSKTNLSDFNALKGEVNNKADKDSTYNKTDVDGKVNTINTNLSRLNGLSGTLTKPDFNTLTNTGVFYIASPDGGKNYPVGSWGTLVVSNGQNARIEQVYYPDNNDAPFIRQDVSGNWKPWVQLAKAADVTNLHNSVAGSLNAKADKISVYSKTDIDSKVNTINGAIGNKAAKTDVTNLQSMISALQVKLESQENTINSLKAFSHSFTAISQADYDKLTDAQKKNGWYAIG